MQITFSLRKLTMVLAIVALGLIGGSAAIDWLSHEIGGRILWGLEGIVGVDGAGILPAWYTSLLLLGCAAAAALGAPTRGRFAPVWWLASAAFALLAADKVAGLHRWGRAVIGSLQEKAGLPGDVWLVTIAATLLAALLLGAALVWSAPTRQRGPLVLAGIVFLAGTIVFDRYGFLFSPLIRGAARPFVEEGLEMAGALLFLHALLGALTLPLDLRIQADAPDPAVHSAALPARTT